MVDIKILHKFRSKYKIRFKIHKIFDMLDNVIFLESWYTRRFQFYPTSYIIHIREDLLKDRDRFNTLLLHEIGHIWNNSKKSDLRDEIQSDCFAIEFGANIDYLLEAFNPNDEEYYRDYQFEPLIRRAFLILKRESLKLILDN